MKLKFAFSVLLMGMMIASCSDKSSKQSCDSSATDTVDTVVMTETEEPAEPELLVTPDLTLLEVKGNVKEIKGKETDNYVYGGNAKFNEKGELTHYGSSDPVSKISNVKRDKDGKLTKFLGSEWITVKWDGERPVSIAEEYNEVITKDTHKYDESGRVVGIDHWFQDLYTDENATEKATVTYPEGAFDAKGNWVKRTVKYPDHTENQARDIIYY